MEVLPGHAKLVTILNSGSIVFNSGRGKEKIDIASGLAEVSTESIIALVEPK